MAINHVWKTVIALFMCVLTLFAFGLKLAVQAHAFAISAGVIGLIAVILGTLGFTFATSAELQRVCSQYYNQASSEIQTAFTSAAELIEDGVIKWNDFKMVFIPSVMFTVTASLVNFFNDGVSYRIVSGYNDYIYQNTFNSANRAFSLNVSSLETNSIYYENGKYYSDLFNTVQGDTIRIRLNQFVHSNADFHVTYTLMQNSVDIQSFTSDYYNAILQNQPSSNFDVFPSYMSIAPCKMIVDNVEYLSIVFAVIGSNGVLKYWGSGDAITQFALTDIAGETVTSYYGEAGAIDDGIIGQAWSDAVAQQYDDTDVIDLADSVPWAASQSTDVIDIGYTQSDVITDVGLQDTVVDLTDTQDTTFPLDIDDYKVPPAWTNPSSGQTIRFADIFPFCIPFDIYDFLSLLSATRTAPHFEIPFTYDRIGLDYTFVLDLSGESWENLAQIVRIMELLAFCIGLAFVTRDLIKG